MIAPATAAMTIDDRPGGATWMTPPKGTPPHLVTLSPEEEGQIQVEPQMETALPPAPIRRRRAKVNATPTCAPPSSSISIPDGGQPPPDVQPDAAPAGILSEDEGHYPDDAQTGAAPSSTFTAGEEGQPMNDAHSALALPPAPICADPVLALIAKQLDDYEGQRKSAANRIRQLVRSQSDSDGELRGLGLDPDAPVVLSLHGILEGLDQIEHLTELELKRRIREHPLYPWVERSAGVGEKVAARLLGIIGDPYWHATENRPRTVSELWAFCGLHVVEGCAARRTKGQRCNWSTEAKTRTYLIAEACLRLDGQPDKNGRPRAMSPYREVYNAGRVKYADAVHTSQCVRCGPKGQPAQPGSPLSDGHKHMRAMRLVMKAVLRDLWREAKRVHDSRGEGHGNSDAHPGIAPAPGPHRRRRRANTGPTPTGPSPSPVAPIPDGGQRLSDAQPAAAAGKLSEDEGQRPFDAQ